MKKNIILALFGLFAVVGCSKKDAQSYLLPTCKKAAPAVSIGVVPTPTSITVTLNVTVNSCSNIAEKGVYISTTPDAKNTGSLMVQKPNGTFEKNGLTADTYYYVIGFAKNDKGTTLTEEKKVKTVAYVTEITTLTGTANSPTNVTLKGTVSSTGPIDAVYFWTGYSPDPGPSSGGTKIPAGGTSSGGFISFDLTINTTPPGVTVYYKAGTTINGVDILATGFESITTPNIITTVTATAGNPIDPHTGQMNANIASNTVTPGITERFFYVSDNNNPGPSDQKIVVSGTGTGAFSANVNIALAGGTKYYRAGFTTASGTTVSNVESVSSIPYSIGLPYHGGKIFYIDATGQHGLICANQDLGLTTGNWYATYGTLVGASGTAIGTGMANTLAIVNNWSSPTCTSAGKACYDYSVTENGITYSDWFLPSLDETQLLYNASLLPVFSGRFSNGVGGSAYLTSTELNLAQCKVFNFTVGIATTLQKGSCDNSIKYSLCQISSF